MTVPLRTLLGDYVTPGLEVPEQGFFRFHDAPPALVRAALDSVDETWGSMRAKGQPPARWLVDVAEELGGRLAGYAHTANLRVDAVSVAGEHAALLARKVNDAFPEVVLGGVALDLALAEAWPTWDAEDASWEGSGRDLLAGRPEPVVGLWWD